MLIVFRKYVRERGKVKKSAGEILACNEVKILLYNINLLSFSKLKVKDLLKLMPSLLDSHLDLIIITW